MRKLKLDELDRPDLTTYQDTQKLDIVLVLDNIRSGMNVGSFFRTADAFLISSIYITGISATPPHKEIHKTAIGADQSVKWTYFSSVTEAVHDLKAKGYQIVGVEQADQSTLLQEFKPDPGSGIALIFGNEVEGLSDEVMEMLDHCIEIPQYGTKHSLNVSVSAGIVIWSIFEKLCLKPPYKSI
ncbi:MAG TPA: RNA methyltransferase [Saprospirales bacterium]|nr:RNA methyltransferase [Saprospirales bacterium]HAY71349.1 RNA methyltransferase [Saprospirales bacterium]HRQ28829.1 RNA methyltransferase [Saprospiraceae bacterium]